MGLHGAFGRKGRSYESKCQRPTKLKMLLYFYGLCSYRVFAYIHKCTHSREYYLLLYYYKVHRISLAEFQRNKSIWCGLISYGYGYGIVYWCRTYTFMRTHFTARIIYCIMLVVLMRITKKKGVYCYCYWTNNFSFPSAMTMMMVDALLLLGKSTLTVCTYALR